MLILTFVAYIIIVVTASGSLRRSPANKSIYWRDVVVWALALLSTLGLPWSGVPLSYYLGAGSWIWFPLVCISLCLLRTDETDGRLFRVFFAIANVAVIMTAFCIFISENGIPGDIPSIEGVGAILSLEGLICRELISAYVCFFISATTSFLPALSRSKRASAMLSFSYSSFLSIAFLPPARLLFSGIMPDTAIIIDTAAYFLCTLLIHAFMMSSLSGRITSAWRCSYVVLNTALTAAGIYLLFAAV